jgi:hypothetical protein
MGWGLGLTRLGVFGLRPGRQRRFGSCGLSALTVDCPSFDQVRAGYRVRPRSGHTARGVWWVRVAARLPKGLSTGIRKALAVW